MPAPAYPPIPSKFLNIDTVDVVAKYTGPPLKMTYSSIITGDEKSLGRICCFKEKIRSNKGPHDVHVIHNQTRQELTIQGSPYGFFYGQNVFSKSTLKGICKRLVRYILTKLQAPLEYIEESLNNPIRLTRVDIALNLKFADQHEIVRVLQQMRRQLMGHQWTRTYASSIYWGTAKRSYEVAMYDKGKELASKRSRQDPHFRSLVEQTTGMLRIELRLRTHELKKLNMDETSAWTNGRQTADIFNKYFNRMHLLDLVTISETDPIFANLGNAERTSLLIAQQDDPHLFRSEENWRRTSHKLRQTLGVDLTCWRDPNEITKLRTLLSDPNRMSATPQWAIECNYAPGRNANGKQSVSTKTTRAMKKNGRTDDSNKIELTRVDQKAANKTDKQRKSNTHNLAGKMSSVINTA